MSTARSPAEYIAPSTIFAVLPDEDRFFSTGKDEIVLFVIVGGENIVVVRATDGHARVDKKAAGPRGPAALQW